MNKKIIAIIVVIAVVVLCVLALVYAPNVLEPILRMHRIPQH